MDSVSPQRRRLSKFPRRSLFVLWFDLSNSARCGDVVCFGSRYFVPTPSWWVAVLDVDQWFFDGAHIWRGSTVELLGSLIPQFAIWTCRATGSIANARRRHDPAGFSLLLVGVSDVLSDLSIAILAVVMSGNGTPADDP